MLPELIGEKAAGHAQLQHEYLYWEIGGWVAIRQGDWRAVKSPKSGWELYELSIDPSESKDLSKTKPEVLAKLMALAEKAHEPAVEGTFSRTDRHERDRRAKFGKQDDTSVQASPSGVTKKQAKHAAATVPPMQGVLPNKDWKVVRFSSENAANQKIARNAIDGDPATLWHTQFTGTVATPPHELVIDLGAERTIRGLVYLGRQDEGWNGAIKEIEFCIGSSPDALGDPVAKAALVKSKEAQTVNCPPTKGRYILLRALSSYSEKGFASVSELGVIGD
jgi:hypothetical protein